MAGISTGELEAHRRLGFQRDLSVADLKDWGIHHKENIGS
jgi:hypothetical protein